MTAHLSHHTVRYRTVFRIANSDSRSVSSAKEVPGCRRFQFVEVNLMFTFAILGSVAVGALLAATAYCICRNEIVRITERRPQGSINGTLESKVFGQRAFNVRLGLGRRDLRSSGSNLRERKSPADE